MLPYWAISADFAERIEIIKGPSVLLDGMPPLGSVGVHHQRRTETSRRHSDRADHNGVRVRFLQLGTHLDRPQAFGEANEFGVRFNGAYRDAETSVETNKEKMALAVFLGPDYRASASGSQRIRAIRNRRSAASWYSRG